MSTSFTTTETRTFTVTHARELASKIRTDLKRIQRLYDGKPSDDWIDAYETEATELLRLGYLSDVTYGFKRNDKWIVPTLRYTLQELASGATDDDPGRIRPGANVNGATFCSFLTYSNSWSALSSQQKQQVEDNLPFKRSTGQMPLVEGGYFVDDRMYSSGGRSLGRASVRSF